MQISFLLNHSEVSSMKMSFEKDVSLRDKQWDAYSLRPWHLLGFGRKPTCWRITTALVCWDKRVIDWDYLEWFLGRSATKYLVDNAYCSSGIGTQCDAKTVCSHQLPNLYPNAKFMRKPLVFTCLVPTEKDGFKMQSHEFIEKQNSTPINVRWGCKI